MARAKKSEKELSLPVFINPFEGIPMNEICGVDEAGRGPLCGPVVAAACILPDGCEIPGLTDSKKLTESKREGLIDVIKQQSLTYCIAMATVEKINTINILEATLLAMRRAIAGLQPSPIAALIDGNVDRDFFLPAKAVIKGDALVPSISAASILAKVTRDRMCLELDANYPQYGIAKHKGYGTALHIAALKEHGPSPIHRTRFIRFLDTVDAAEDTAAAQSAIAAAKLPDACAFYQSDGSVSSYILDYKRT